jgi:hypothetical protein
MKKILYLHGLESSNVGDKVDFLKERAVVLAPSIDYRKSNIEEELMYMIESFQPDLVIGSSMGGYAALNLGNYFDIPVIAFNPAIHSRSFDPAFKELVEQDPHFNFIPTIVLGLKDDVINPSKTVDIFDNADFEIQYELYPELGHRISFDVFVDIYNKYVK